MLEWTYGSVDKITLNAWKNDCQRPNSMNACNYWIQKHNIQLFTGNGTGTLPSHVF